MPHIPANPTSAAAGMPDRNPRTPRARNTLPDPRPAVRRKRHTINAAQKAKYWRAWAEARRMLIRSGEYSPHEADNFRHELHLQALGEMVSSTQLDNRQFDLVLAAFARISDPGSITAQMDGESGPRRRLLHSLEKLAHGRVEYIAEICGDCFGHANWRRLGDADLGKLRMTMERRVTRKADKGGSPNV